MHIKERLAGIRHSPAIIAVAAITLVGLALRVVSCFRDWPMHLHVDEPTVVKSAIDMLSRHSWESFVYYRPDQLEIKVDSIVFTVFSFLKYHVPAYEAFATHETAFYVVARFVTALCGTAMIPLSANLVWKLLGRYSEAAKTVGAVLASVLIAFSTVYVRHSSYATPDIVLALICLLLMRALLKYLRQPNLKTVVWCASLVGMGMTVKYPGAVLAVPLAAAVCYKEGWRQRSWATVGKYAGISVAVVAATIFVIAPNLVTDISNVIAAFLREARPNHLGSDGLGFFGNMGFYAQLCVQNFGVLTVPLIVVGARSIIANRQSAVVLVGVFFGICICCISLHWERWGTPLYLSYTLLAAMGAGALFDWIRAFQERQRVARAARVCSVGALCLICASSLVSGTCFARYCLLPTTMGYADKYLKDNGIDANNSVDECYNPLHPIKGWSIEVYRDFSVVDGKAVLHGEHANAEYLVLGTSFRDRYYSEPERYGDQIATYEAVDNTFDVIYSISSSESWEPSFLECVNICKGIHYLLTERGPTGDSGVVVYRLT